MAVAAAQTQYRQEILDTFEQKESWLRMCTTKEFVKKGNTATFLTAGTSSATAVSRGTNSLIPSRAPSGTQASATLAEWHDLQEMTDFNIFASQGDWRKKMQEDSVIAVNRKIDDDIIAQLDTATNDTGATVKASPGLVEKGLTILALNNVPLEEEDNLFAIITPAFRAYMRQSVEYTSGDFQEVKMLSGPVRKVWRALGVNWIVSTRITNVGSASSAAKCYLFHRRALGHALDLEALDTAIGYDEKHKISWARASGYFGSKLLQNSGVVQMLHDDSEYVAA